MGTENEDMENAMKNAHRFAIVSALALPFAIAVLSSAACKKEEEPPPPPMPTPAPAPAEPLAVAPEQDAGSDATEDADADAGKVITGPAIDPTGIRACCAALRGNAKSAPPDQVMLYNMAAAVCDGLVNNPQGRAALGQVRAALRGASVPAACQ